MKASVFVGSSLDGFIARLNHRFDFLPAEGGEPQGFREFFASVDALVMGRNTYDVVLGIDPWPYGPKPVIVLSSRPLVGLPIGMPPEMPVERMSGEPAAIVAALATRGIGHIYVDGGVTIQRFLRAGLIHRITETRVPVLIGQGIPLFGPLERDVQLRHIATRDFAGGLVQSEYEVIG
jgi:dihydrofolate reductase